MYLVPPMTEEPPGDFVEFVAAQLAYVQREAARLVGGPQHADEIYPMVLSDVAGHWRRLRWRSRLAGRDATGEFLIRRLAARAKQWREDQIYEVEVHLLRPPAPATALPASYALRKAAVLPGTRRDHSRPIAEASIAWTHACRRAQWHRIARIVTAVALVFVAVVQAVPSVPD
ncbi:MAG TPA: hypothetical protein VFR35_19355 [Actinoplanes sp.]|nr:hypothetical protein [Actinoplanes sp.]